MDENNEIKDIEKIEKFIFNKDVQKVFSQINNSVMDVNILDIIGMGRQEIKYSNLLAWMFGDNEHGLHYEILEGFLKKIIEINTIKNVESLKHYIYFPKNNKNILVYREKHNIDLLLVDTANKVVIVVENKIDALELSGQLEKYKKYVDKTYKKEDGYQHYFIFLTTNMIEASDKKNWMLASHQMIGEVVEEIVKNKNLNDKTELLLTSYVDLLKRRNIMKHQELEKLCQKIWLNKEYKEALDILLQYRRTKLDIFYDKLINDSGINFVQCGQTNIYCIRTKVSEKILNKIKNEHNWDTSEDFIIELEVNKYKNYIWFGYYHPDADKLIENVIFNKIYRQLFEDSKIKKEHKIMKITEDDIYKYSDFSELLEKTIAEIQSEIKEFEKVVNSLLN